MSALAVGKFGRPSNSSGVSPQLIDRYVPCQSDRPYPHWHERSRIIHSPRALVDKPLAVTSEPWLKHRRSVTLSSRNSMCNIILRCRQQSNDLAIFVIAENRCASRHEAAVWGNVDNNWVFQCSSRLFRSEVPEPTNDPRHW